MPSACRHQHRRTENGICPNSSPSKTSSSHPSARARPSHRTAPGSPTWRRGRTGSTCGCRASTRDDDAQVRDRRRQPQRAHLPAGPTIRVGCCTPRTATATRTGTCTESTWTNPDAAAVDLTPFPGVKAVLRLARRTARQGHRRPQQAGTSDCSTLTNSTSPPVNSRCSPRIPATSHRWLCSRNGELFATSLTPDGDVELSRWDSDAPARCIPSPCSTAPTIRWASIPMVITPDGTGVWLGSNRQHRPHPAGPARPGHRRGDRGRQPPDIRPGPRHTSGPLLAAHPQSADRELLGARYLGERQVIHALDPHFADGAGEPGETVRR